MHCDWPFRLPLNFIENRIFSSRSNIWNHAKVRIVISAWNFSKQVIWHLCFEVMFVQIRQKLLFNTVTKYGKQNRYSISAISEVKDEAKDTEEVYPPIEDLSLKARSKRKKQAWHEKIKNIYTVEEKLFELNMPRFYGWKSLFLNEHTIPYNSLSHAQYITRTHVIKESGLPAYYNNVISTEQLDSIAQAIKSDIEDNIIFEHCIRRLVYFYYIFLEN